MITLNFGLPPLANKSKHGTTDYRQLQDYWNLSQSNSLRRSGDASGLRPTL